MTVLGGLGVALTLAAGARWREPGSDLLAGLGCVLAGAWLLAAGAPWPGAADVTAGALLLWSWWRKGGHRDRAKRALGAKSAALRAALVRTVRDRAVPVPV